MMRFATSKSQSSAPVKIDVAGRSEQVLRYRKEEFERFGFASYVAEYLASTQIDLHRMEDLLKAGCAHDVALRILNGTTWKADVNDPAWETPGSEDIAWGKLSDYAEEESANAALAEVAS